MEKESKSIIGQWYNGRLHLTDHEKRIIIQDYLSGNESKQAVYKRYTGYPRERGKITDWMRKFDIEDKFEKKSNFVSMSSHKKDKESSTKDFETLKLKKRIAELEKQVQTAEMKATAFSTMVDIAEKEFNIPIKKKHNTKL